MRRFNTLECPSWLPFLLPQVPAPLRHLRRQALGHANTVFDSNTPRHLLVARTLLWPLLATLHGARAMRQHHHIVTTETGWGQLRQLLHLTGCMLTLNLRPQDYYEARIYRPGRRHRARMILPEREAQALLATLQPAGSFPTLTNKVRFHWAATAAGLPVPVLVASFIPGGPAPASLELPPADLFAKPAGRWGGSGAELWLWHQGRWSTGDESLGAPALLDRLAARGRTETWLLQLRLHNHPDWARLTPGALCTARIVTLRHPDGTITPLLAFLRLPRAGATVDNLSAGGLAADIDLDTGRLGPARRIAMHTPDHLVHPDTGYAFAGTVLPGWPALCALAVRAHRSFPQAYTVGWDVALATAGPVLIEANLRWGLPLDTLVGETPFVDFCLSLLAARAAPLQPPSA